MPQLSRLTGLGELESAVLQYLWDEGPQATATVHRQLGRSRGLAYTTILTVLQRLTKKGLTVRESVGRTHVYAAAETPEEFTRRRAQSLATEVVGLGRVGLAAFLREANRLDPETVALLRRETEQRT